MTSIWDGAYLRGTVSEDGAMPRSSNSNSPDIIINGLTPLQDPSILTQESDYNKVYPREIYMSQFNYLYVRTKNFHKGPINGLISLYYAESNLLLYPSQWNQLSTANNESNIPFSVNGQYQIAANNDAYTWIPSAPTQGHYCLIATIEDDLNSSPIIKGDTISSLAEVLSDNGNICQLNTKQVTTPGTFITDFVAYSQGEEASICDVNIIGENIPLNSDITISSGSPIPGYGNIIIEEKNSTQINFKKGAPDISMPASYKSVFTWTLTIRSDTPLEKEPSITLRVELVVDGTNKLYSRGQFPDPNPITGEIRRNSNGPMKVIRVGEMTFKSPNAGGRKMSDADRALLFKSTIRPPIASSTSTGNSALRIVGSKQSTKYSSSVSAGTLSAENTGTIISSNEIAEVNTIGMNYPQLTFSGETVTPNIPDSTSGIADLSTLLEYVQDAEYEEINLDIEWKNVPNGMYMALSSPEYSDFEVNKTAVSGSSSKGVISRDTSPFSAKMEFQLWGENIGIGITPEFTISITAVITEGETSLSGARRHGTKNRAPTSGPVDLKLLGKAAVKI